MTDLPHRQLERLVPHNPDSLVRGLGLNLLNLNGKSLSSVWCGLATALVAASWLLPNHTQPWLQFHQDAWMAAILTVIGLAVLVNTEKLAITGLDLLIVLA